MYFLPKYIGSRDEVFQMTVEEFERTNIQKYGYMVNEYMSGNPVVRPYYDWDCTIDGDLNDEVIEINMQSFKEALDRLHPGAEIAFAQRNGYKPDKQKNIVSLRAFVKGYKMRVADIRTYINMTFSSTTEPAELDRKVYKPTEQCLAVINGYKTKNDRRVLKPITHVNEKRAFLAQYLYGDEQEISVKDEVPVTSLVAKDPTVLNVTINKQYINHIHVHLPLAGIPNQLTPWERVCEDLIDYGFQNPKFVSVKEDGYNFGADRAVNCPLPLCRNIHTSNHWYAMQIIPELYVVKNYSDKCKADWIMSKNMQVLQGIMECPKQDCDYAQLFANIYKGVIFWTNDNRFMAFRNERWSELHICELTRCLFETLNLLLTKLAKHLNDRAYLMEQEGADHREESKRLRRYYNNVTKAVQITKNDTRMKSIINTLRNLLWNGDFETDLDSNPHLLGTDNGVIDLKTCTFRKQTPNDMVALSIGYDYLTDEHIDPVIEQEFATFIEQIYPKPEIREIMQRFLGYCLLGNHPEKIFLLLTDKREGFNGKSTIAKLVAKAMGPYGRKGGKALLYKSDQRFETVNSHNSGILAYKGKRFAFFEEMDPNERLDCAELKDYNGGNSEVTGRMAGKHGEHKFIWSTKMMLLFNDKSFPQFNFDDKALVDRMLMVSHESRFYADEEEYLRNQHVPNTFRADCSIDEKMDAWRPYYLKWALEGLKRYWDVRFRTIPAQCKQWRSNLCDEQDVVKEFVNAYVIKVDDMEKYITQNTAYDIFLQNFPSEQARKTKMGRRKFSAKLCDLLDKTSYKEEQRKMADGTHPRNSWIGYAFVESD